METYWGGDYQLYMSGSASSTLQEAYAHWSDASYQRVFPLIIPYYEGNIPSGVLFDHNNVFNNALASELDAHIPMWQQMSTLFCVSNDWGTVPLNPESTKALFPFATDIGDGSTTMYITHPDVDGVVWICNTASAASGGMPAYGCFNKNDGTAISGVAIPLIVFSLWGWGRRGGRQSWPLVLRNTAVDHPTSCKMLSSTGSATDGMSGKMTVGTGWVSDMALNWDQFYKVCVWDYEAPLINDENPYGDGTGFELPDGYVQSEYDYLPDEVNPGLNVPAFSVANTGFCTMYTPALSQLRDLASYMWSPTFEQAILKLFSNPMEAILGLMVIPYTITGGTSREVKIGNVSTGVYMPAVTEQFYTLNCGTITIPTPTTSYLDYNPFTKYWLYLPYCGTHPINVDEVLGKTLGVQYLIDILSGACVAEVTVNGSVKYTFAGMCGVQIPINQTNFNQLISSVVSIAASIGSMIFSGGATAPAAIGSIAGSVVNGMKEHVEKSGAIGSTSGAMSIQKPMLYGEAPVFCSGAEFKGSSFGQNAMQGFPQFKVIKLSKLKGYTECESVHLEGIPCTANELTEIESLLKEGVIIKEVTV